MIPRSLTLAQAHALIPWLHEVFSDQQSDVLELLETRGRGPGATRRAALEKRIRARVEAVTALGIRVRRVDGEVDIPSVRDGDPVLLSWRLGDQRIHRWRPAESLRVPEA